MLFQGVSAVASAELVNALHCSGAGVGKWRQLSEMLDEGFDLVAPEPL